MASTSKSTITNEESLHRSLQPKPPLVLERRQANVLLEQLREGALAAKTVGACHFVDLRVFALQRFARGLDAQLHDERLRTAAEGAHELPMQLPRRNVDGVRQLLHRNAGAEML